MHCWRDCNTFLMSIFLKVFLSVVKSELCAFHLEHFSQLGRSAEEDGHFAFSLGWNLLEHFVPVRPTSIGSSLQSCDQVPLGLWKRKKNVKQLCHYRGFLWALLVQNAPYHVSRNQNTTVLTLDDLQITPQCTSTILKIYESYVKFWSEVTYRQWTHVFLEFVWNWPFLWVLRTFLPCDR